MYVCGLKHGVAEKEAKQKAIEEEEARKKKELKKAEKEKKKQETQAKKVPKQKPEHSINDKHAGGALTSVVVKWGGYRSTQP